MAVELGDDGAIYAGWDAGLDDVTVRAVADTAARLARLVALHDRAGGGGPFPAGIVALAVALRDGPMALGFLPIVRRVVGP